MLWSRWRARRSAPRNAAWAILNVIAHNLGRYLGRIVLIAGKLVVYSRTLRDIHRFGFEDLSALAAEGMKAVGQAVAMIDTHPELARD